ncbi:hypothetical protein JOQ06_001336, partial [Pogonophryne albipinna]
VLKGFPDCLQAEMCLDTGTGHCYKTLRLSKVWSTQGVRELPTQSRVLATTEMIIHYMSPCPPVTMKERIQRGPP